MHYQISLFKGRFHYQNYSSYLKYCLKVQNFQQPAISVSSHKCFAQNWLYLGLTCMHKCIEMNVWAHRSKHFWIYVYDCLYTGMYVTVCAWLVIYAYCAFITVCLCSCLYFMWCVWIVVRAVKSKSRHKYVLFLQKEISHEMAYNQRKRKFISSLFYLMFAQIGVPLIW